MSTRRPLTVQILRWTVTQKRATVLLRAAEFLRAEATHPVQRGHEHARSAYPSDLVRAFDDDRLGGRGRALRDIRRGHRGDRARLRGLFLGLVGLRFRVLVFVRHALHRMPVHLQGGRGSCRDAWRVTSGGCTAYSEL